MTEEERGIYQQMLDLLNKQVEKMQTLLGWVIILCFAICALTVSNSINASIQHRIETTEIVHDYFTTDYDYGSIEQNVDVRTGE